ncbi:MAG: hypothetical protein ACREMZ_10870 [Gemmatimonadales bacterium]
MPPDAALSRQPAWRPRYVASPDSSSSLLLALARALRGRGFPMLGFPRALQPLFPALNCLPRRVREIGYGRAAWLSAMPPTRLGRVSGERVAQWMTHRYEWRRYPAVAIGSSNGALVHLCAALGVPWLPQTFLTLVRQPGRHPDDVRAAVAHALEPARRLVDANPDLAVYQLHDPVNDRPVLNYAAYFRVKRRALGYAYREFLDRTLAPGGTLLLVECERTWPATLVGNRHLFQLGGVGGVKIEDYFQGGPRVAAFLEHYGSPYRRWDPPAPQGEYSEAEWGFELALRDDVISWARSHHCRLVRLVFDEPEHLSSPVADLYRWWYRRRGQPADRLVVDSFFLLDPWWTLRTGAAPYWAVFNTEPSARCLAEYLDTTEPYEDIYAMLLSNMVDAIGGTPPAEWRRIIASRARRTSDLLGVDESEYPRDLGTIARYHPALKRLRPHRPPPAPLTLAELEEFLTGRGDRPPVRWIEVPT